MTFTDVALIFGIFCATIAAVCWCVLAIVVHFPPDTDDERAESARDNQRNSHPEIW